MVDKTFSLFSNSIEHKQLTSPIILYVQHLSNLMCLLDAVKIDYHVTSREHAA